MLFSFMSCVLLAQAIVLASSHCDFDIVAADKLSLSTFAKYKAGPGRPILIQGAALNWAAIESWTPDLLLHEMQQLKVKSSQYFFRRIESASGNIILTPPNEFYHEQTTLHPHGQMSYRFSDQERDILRTFRPLEFVDLSNHSLPWFQGSFEHYISVGIDDESGLFFHQHGEAFNALVVGKKHWMLVEPTHNVQLPALSYEDFDGKSHWLKHILPKMKKHILQCDQNAGDVVFIPNGWFHAVRNVGVTAAISGVKLVTPAMPRLDVFWEITNE